MSNTNELITMYRENIKDDLNKLEETISILTASKLRSYQRSINLKTAIIILSLSVGIIGIILTASDTLQISDTLKAWISLISGLLGFFITFITANFDPVKFRKRTIDLSNLIDDFDISLDQFRISEREILAIENQQDKLTKIKELAKEVSEKRNKLMEQARSVKSSI